MDRNKRNIFKKFPSNQFKRKGVSRKGNWNHSSHEELSGDSHPIDTVYRILCPSRKIGGVIGKGGGIIKGLREETHAKITVADPVPGSDERVIIIYSSPEKISRNQNNDKGSTMENNQDTMEPHCAAQDALLKVHDRIVEEDIFGGKGADNENSVVTSRLLVPYNMVGCVLGKRGDVIQRLRSETGASVRVLPADQLPSCAMGTDELVQISANPNVAKRALYEVSTLLHQNPRKDKPLDVSMPYARQSFHSPGGPMMNMPPPGNPMWPHRNNSAHNMPPMPLMGKYGSQHSGFGQGGFDGVPPGHGAEPSAEFSLKILCSAGKIGGVIGKGGSNVKVVQQETGASIHVEDASAESDERVIRISASEALWNPRSKTIDAILQLQNKTSEFSEKGTIITRLLVPSSKVGCLLGQGGQIINEMRRRTLADIRVFSKDEKPKFASEDEELVQISGNFSVAKDALSEIASRLRVRTLRDANGGTEPGPVGPGQGFGTARSLPGRGPPPSGMMGPSSSGGYEASRGSEHEYERRSYPVPPPVEHEYERRSYPVPPPVVGSRYQNVNSGLEDNGVGGMPYAGEVAGTRMKFQDPMSGGPENFRQSSEHLSSRQSIHHPFVASSGQNMNGQQGFYQNSYQTGTAQQSVYQHPNSQQNSYPNMNAQQNPYPNMNAQQNPYPNLNIQHNPYSHNAPQGVYGNPDAPQATFHNISTQQGTYQY
ncbi:KH domain-containing protein At4g18375-like [Mercurialis annua]|uniref:KH domain-containing protein At4g18375-like n=1 Tax=Mercurialis annua TaxID=3986 RepID=UPI00215F3EB7|nr:KH domain-containing protein At4g18375-like [Mercurialis annua]XP_050227803.1 KH domain-containing protein At4g18375-like [Mercurialis annua]